MFLNELPLVTFSTNYESQKTQIISNVTYETDSVINPFQTKNSYSSYIETDGEVMPVLPIQPQQSTAAATSSTSKLNKAIYSDPSQAGITRIHINHISTGGSVGDRIKQVNELAAKQQFQRTTSGSRARSVSPINDLLSRNMSSGGYKQSQSDINNNKKDSGTSPITVLTTAKYIDAGTQIMKENNEHVTSVEKLDKKLTYTAQFQTSLGKKDVELDLDKASLGKKKQPKLVLEKSKLIVVNLTPKQSEETGLIENIVAANISSNQRQLQNDTDDKLVAELLNIEGRSSLSKVNKSNDLKNNENLKLNLTDASRFELNDQTPVSTSSKTKSNLDRSSSQELLNFNLSGNNEKNNPNVSQKAIDQQSTTEILNLKTSSYYNDIKNKTNDTQFSNFTAYVRDPAREQQLSVANTVTSKKTKKSYRSEVDYDATDNTEEAALTTNEEGDAISKGSNRIKSMKLCVNKAFEGENETDSARTKKSATFYNGDKIWTAITDVDSCDENDESSPKEKSVKEDSKKSDKTNDDELEVLVTDGNSPVKKASPKKTKKSVKINLPNEEGSPTKNRLSLKKTRKVQKCCFVIFLLILFFIVTAILIYFFVWNLVAKRPLLKRS